MLSVQQWGNLTRALEFYTARGYNFIDAPWHASPQAIGVTLPPGCNYTEAREAVAGRTAALALVGSAEQSFIDLWLRGELPDRRPVVALTPCFRLADDNPSTCHHPYFMKVELGYFAAVWPSERAGGRPIEAHLLDALSYADMMRGHAVSLLLRMEARRLVARQEAPVLRTRAVEGGRFYETPLGDLEVAGVEVGSYGARAFEDDSGSTVVWAYGTGLAEPRSSWAIERSRA